MKAFLKQVSILFPVVMVSACSSLLQTQSDPVPVFSHSTPVRQLQPIVSIAKRIQPAAVYFANDSHDITASNEKSLLGFLDQFSDRHRPAIVIEGHTDSSSSDAYNLTLSKKRIQRVSDRLTEFGYPPDRIIVIARGETQPVATNATEAGRQRNRRVTIHIYPEVIQ